jgi:hypothetical protein
VESNYHSIGYNRSSARGRCTVGKAAARHCLPGIVVHDHIIVGENGHASLKRLKLIRLSFPECAAGAGPESIPPVPACGY